MQLRRHVSLSYPQLLKAELAGVNTAQYYSTVSVLQFSSHKVIHKFISYLDYKARVVCHKSNSLWNSEIASCKYIILPGRQQ